MMKNKIIDGLMFVLLGIFCYMCATIYINSFKVELLFSQRVAMATGFIMFCYLFGSVFGKLGNKIKKYINKNKGEE